MYHFFFVFDVAARSYPLRFWIRPEGASDASAPANLADLDGTLDPAASETLLEELRRVYPEPGHAVARMYATDWEGVEDNFPGLYFT